MPHTYAAPAAARPPSTTREAPLSKINWRPFLDFVDRHNRFLLVTHMRPDGDALGCEVAMAGILRQKGKHVVAVNPSRTPDRYRFLDPDGRILHFADQLTAAQLAQPPYAPIDAIIILDTSSWNQLGDMADFIRRSPAEKAVVDHHLSQDDMGAEVFKDTDAEAAAVLVFHAGLELGVDITPEIAEALFTALATDTGWFRFATVRPATLRTAARLVDFGAQPAKLYPILFEQNSLGRLKLMGRVLDRLEKTCDGRVACTWVELVDYVATGAKPPDTEDLVNFTLSLSGVEVGLIFVEQLGGGVKVSFRARNGLDCRRLAEQFGGGGHANAAGATLLEPLAEAKSRVLEAVAAQLP